MPVTADPGRDDRVEGAEPVAVFVVVALALAVVAVGGVVVAALQLRGAVSGLRDRAGTAGQRLTPLTDELTDEAAVTAVELEALQDSVARLSASRQRPQRVTPTQVV